MKLYLITNVNSIWKYIFRSNLIWIWFRIELLSKDLRPYRQHSGVSQVRQRLKPQCCLHQGRGGLVGRWGKLAVCQLGPLQTKTNRAFYTKYERPPLDGSFKISKGYDASNRSYSRKKKKLVKSFFWSSHNFLFFLQYRTLKFQNTYCQTQNKCPSFF